MHAEVSYLCDCLVIVKTVSHVVLTIQKALRQAFIMI